MNQCVKQFVVVMMQPQQQQFEIRDITQDGNEFYVFMSLCLFDSHIKAAMIRDVLTTFLCFNAFACPSVGALKDDAKITDSARRFPWYREWEQALQTPDSNLDRAGVEFVRMNSRQGFRTPIRVACALMHTCYNTTIRLYTYDERNQKMVAEASGTWVVGGHNGGGGGGVYLLVESHTNHLRLITGSDITPEQIQRSFPGSVAAAPCVTSDIIKQSAEYALMGYDPQLRTSFEVAYFLSPLHHGVKSACNMHILPIDAQRMPKGMKCSIIYKGGEGGGGRMRNPLSVFALRRGEREGVGGGQRKAILINFWQVSFAEPVVDVQMFDEMVILVESKDLHEATAIIQKHFLCTVSLSSN